MRPQWRWARWAEDPATKLAGEGQIWDERPVMSLTPLPPAVSTVVPGLMFNELQRSRLR